MPEKRRGRALSGNRYQRRRPASRHSSLNGARKASRPRLGRTVILSGVDLRTTFEKIEDLEKEIRDRQDDFTPETYLQHLVLLQVYTNLEYGDLSLENARCYLKLSEHYFHQKFTYLFQAKLHALNAREILDQLNIKPSDDHPVENSLAVEIYLQLVRCSLSAKKYLSRNESNPKNRYLLSVDISHIQHDLQLLEQYLEKLSLDADRFRREYVFLKFEAIVLDPKKFDPSIHQLVSAIEKYLSTEPIKRQIELNIRSGTYLLNFDEKKRSALNYYERAVELAEQQEAGASSREHRHQLAHALLQRSQAKVRADRATDETEKEFLRAMKLYQQSQGHVLAVIDELASYYLKMEKYQDALNVLCESLPEKIGHFGDFSEEVIQTESRIGSIYLREGECLNAAEHLKACLDLQEFVYGPKDPRTCQTRQTVEILKKDPMVCRTYFARMDDRPAFRSTNRVSHDRTELEWIQTVAKKPSLRTKK